jgi:hypothetical protein
MHLEIPETTIRLFCRLKNEYSTNLLQFFIGKPTEKKLRETMRKSLCVNLRLKNVLTERE